MNRLLLVLACAGLCWVARADIEVYRVTVNVSFGYDWDGSQVNNDAEIASLYVLTDMEPGSGALSEGYSYVFGNRYVAGKRQAAKYWSYNGTTQATDLQFYSNDGKSGFLIYGGMVPMKVAIKNGLPIHAAGLVSEVSFDISTATAVWAKVGLRLDPAMTKRVREAVGTTGSLGTEGRTAVEDYLTSKHYVETGP